MKKWQLISLITSVIIFLIIIVIILFFLIIPKSGRKGSIAEDISLGIPSCELDVDYFTHPPNNLVDIESITPLGNLNPSGHTFPTDHMYINFYKDANNIPVYAIGNVWVKNVTRMEKYTNGVLINTDYSINFKPCREIDAYYIHVNELEGVLKNTFEEKYSKDDCDDSYETGGNVYKNCNINVGEKFSAGDILGYTAKKGQINYDIGVNDTRIQIPGFIDNFTFSKWLKSIYSTACPLDYFSEDIKTKLYSVVGNWNSNKRTIEPICGTLRQDEWGTAQGHWFHKSLDPKQERGQEDMNIALVHDVIDYDMGVFSVGIALEDKGLQSSTYIFEPKDSGFVNRDFNQVKPDGNKYCYVANGGSDGHHSNTGILIEMPNEETLRVGKLINNNCNNSTNWNYQNGFVEYVR